MKTETKAWVAAGAVIFLGVGASSAWYRHEYVDSPIVSSREITNFLTLTNTKLEELTKGVKVTKRKRISSDLLSYENRHKYRALDNGDTAVVVERDNTIVHLNTLSSTVRLDFFKQANGDWMIRRRNLPEKSLDVFYPGRLHDHTFTELKKQTNEIVYGLSRSS